MTNHKQTDISKLADIFDIPNELVIESLILDYGHAIEIDTQTGKITFPPPDLLGLASNYGIIKETVLVFSEDPELQRSQARDEFKELYLKFKTKRRNHNFPFKLDNGKQFNYYHYDDIHDDIYDFITYALVHTFGPLYFYSIDNEEDLVFSDGILDTSDLKQLNLNDETWLDTHSIA